jgi:hypothetical protein
MYLVVPVISPLTKRKVELENGEGVKGNWVEGSFSYRFIIYKGKYYSTSLLQRTRFTVDVGLTSRLTRDESSPLLPLNNKFGIGVDLLLSKLDGLRESNTTLIWLTSQVHHYSNGQADTFFIEGPVQRNNYKSGNFSTNYYRFMLNIAHAHQQKNILQGSIGYQRDFDPGGPFGRSSELKKYYGDSRMLLSFQFTRKPKRENKIYLDRSTIATDSVSVAVRKQFSFRTELEYILGDLSNFLGEAKYRFGWHVYLTYMPSVTNEVGIIAHTFLGRDYLNIRFDDPIFIASLGLFVKFNSK